MLLLAKNDEWMSAEHISNSTKEEASQYTHSIIHYGNVIRAVNWTFFI